jgi:hypothetical protein
VKGGERGTGGERKGQKTQFTFLQGKSSYWEMSMGYFTRIVFIPTIKIFRKLFCKLEWDEAKEKKKKSTKKRAFKCLQSTSLYLRRIRLRGLFSRLKKNNKKKIGRSGGK